MSSSIINSTPSSSSSSSSDVIDLTSSSSSDDVGDGEAITTSISSRSRRKSITPDRYTDMPQTKRTRVSRQSSTTTRQTKRVSTLNEQNSEEEGTTTATTATIAAAAAAGGSARKISSARQNQRAFLNQRSEEGTGGKFYFKNRADNDDAMEASNDTTQEYTGKNINGYFEVDEILDRRTRKYGSEANGLRHVVEYCK